MLTAALQIVGALTLIFLAGAAFALGVALVCRWLEWAPVNTTVTVNNNFPKEDDEP